LGLLIGSGGAWRTIANGLDFELSKLTAKNVSEARAMLKNAINDVEVCGDWKRIYSKTANKNFPEISLPYRGGMSAFEGTLKNDEVFYRVYSKNIEGPWLVRFNPKDMSPTELKNMLALKHTPIGISKVKVPAGTKVRVGNAGEIKKWGKGGVTQWEILKGDKSLEDLGIVFEDLGKI
jgi:hypothetical protein